MSDIYSDRIRALRKKILEHGYDRYVLSDEMNVRYLTGIPVPQSPYFVIGSNGKDVLLVPSDGARTSKEKSVSKVRSSRGEDRSAHD